MIGQYAHSLAHFLQVNPNWGWFITFFISLLEALPIVGTVVPGSITMTAVGMLIGSSILPLGLTLLWATLGAFLGDLIGYGLGKYYNEGLRQKWPFRTHPQWLEAGENFFHRHGGKSIIIGRFIGPLRSIIPLIAGLLQMPLQRFVIAAIPSSFIWALVYMLPGIFIGALSLQLPPNVATKFILILLLGIVLLSAFAWLINFCTHKIRKFGIHLLKKMWYHLQSSKHYEWFTRLIASKDQESSYQQLGWFILAMLTFSLFLITIFNVFSHSEMILLNKPIFEFLRSVRTAKIDKVMIAITLLGDARVIIISTLFILGWLLVHRNKYAAVHWLIAMFIALLIPNIFKYLLYFPRPTGLLHNSSTSSFPSGHTFVSTMFYGFVAMFIASHIQRFKRYPYYIAICIILLVAFSRLYLGAHWLTDVLASIFLGIGFLSLVLISYRRTFLPVKIFSFVIFTLFTTIVIWLSYFALTYQKNLLRYSLTWPSQIIDENTWWGNSNPALPIYRENRIGNPTEPMNIQFSGDIQQVKNILALEGWTTAPSLTLLTNTLQKLSQASFNPYLPTLYLNKPPVLSMMKSQDNIRLVFRLWQSNVYLSETWDVMYIGNIVQYQLSSNKEKIIYSYNVIGQLLPFFSNNEWRMKIISANKIPYDLLIKKWNGEILQISAPTLY